MKRILPFIAFMILCLVASSCFNASNSSKGKMKIKSEVPIKTNILGLTLCEERSELSVKWAITNFLEGEDVHYHLTINETCTSIEARPYDLTLFYGGVSWMQARIYRDKNDKIYVIRFETSFIELEDAVALYDKEVSIIQGKYGKGNVEKQEELSATTWTDGTNTIDLYYQKGKNGLGQVRYYCYLAYFNNDLVESIENSQPSPDV